MLRPLALLAAVLALAVAPARAAEPLDLDITRLGPPDAAIWLVAEPTLTAGQAQLLASDARLRFAMLSSELILSLTSSLLQPAATVGHSGFAFDIEGAYTQVHKPEVGTGTFTAPGSTVQSFPRNYWPTHNKTPTSLLVPSFHVRKALPYSLELGGRILYLSQSSYIAAQLTGKWAIQEGYAMIPDVAVLVAHTILLGQKDLNLSATDFTLMTSKRFGVNAAMSLTPYLAARLLRMHAGSEPIGYAPDFALDGSPAPAGRAAVVAQTGRFPSFSHSLYRTTLGLRMTAAATTLALEGTYFGGGHYKANGDYAAYSMPSSVSGAFKLGFEF